jgi:nicotinate-nucleotide pyrophosphorylase (carboxylating)
MFTPDESAACRRLIELAVAEDLGARGDVTSQATIPAALAGQAVFRARAVGVLAGLPAAELVIRQIDGHLRFEALRRDGSSLAVGDTIAKVSGPMRSILAAERIALNFLQHLSGIATLTRRFVDAVRGCPVKILDTRKTLPGWRLLAKYAVRCGGGHNHRLGLHDGILVKDNHLAALPNPDRSLKIEEAVHLAKSHCADVPVEIEVDSLEQLDAALGCQPAIILCDNMPAEMLREAVRRRNLAAPSVQLEASGGITLANVRAIAESGVERISIGALTHSAPALDIALDYEPA